MRVSRQPCKSSWRPAPAAEANVERLRRLARDELGSVLVETALIFPTLMLLTFGLITLGFITNNYISLTSATSAAARQFALDAPVSTTSISTTPYTNLQSQLKASSGLLASLNKNAAQASTGGIVLSSVCVYSASSTCGGNTCNSDASCSTLLANSQNDIVTVKTSFPCFVAIPLYGLNSCTLTAAATFVVQ